ncbi:hypothetical protein [Nostoc sp. ChiVER01]|uniref:YciI family protein n=1 Tax=Nostoc sp. ChiVER01 TaxID=3075382 RepID=UPI002AD306CA|nr:hypothetical protein [Nostoc sp. ChiVER01]MDZ8225700.1 hypothetical protein [Nostoc sp. ChiVER01]
MKYVLLIYLEENAMSQTEREDCYVKSAQLAQQLNSKGQYLATAPLHPVATATSIRVRDGKSLGNKVNGRLCMNIVPSPSSRKHLKLSSR